MALPLIVSIVHRVQGIETLSHFMLIEGAIIADRCCSGCGTHLWDRLLPVELSDGGEVDQDERRGEPLCRVCSYRTAKRIGAAWPSLSPDDIASLWRDVTAEQAREVERELEGYRAAALEETKERSLPRRRPRFTMASTVRWRWLDMGAHHARLVSSSPVTHGNQAEEAAK